MKIIKLVIGILSCSSTVFGAAQSLDEIFADFTPDQSAVCYESVGESIFYEDEGRPTVNRVKAEISKLFQTNHPNEYYVKLVMNYQYVSDRPHNYEKELTFRCQPNTENTCTFEDYTVRFAFSENGELLLDRVSMPQTCDISDENARNSCRKTLETMKDVITLDILAKKDLFELHSQESCR